VLALAGVIIIGFGVILSQWGLWTGWRWFGHMPMMGWGMALGAFVVPLMLFLVLAVIFSWGPKESWDWNHKSREISIVRERYARGEITKEQYEQLLKDLGYR